MNDAVRVRVAGMHHRSLFQPREPAFWVFLTLVAYGAMRIGGTLAQLSAISHSGWALAWLLLAIYALPVAILIVRLDLYEREPLSLAAGAFLWGAFAATALSLDAGGWNQVLALVTTPTFAARWAPAITAPVVEETLKGLGVVLLYLIARDEVADTMDGFVYGALVGLGFAVIEDVAYFMAAFGGTPAGVLHGFYVRVLSSGLYGHVLFTALTGMGVGAFVSLRGEASPGRRLAIALGLFALAILGHALWNSPTIDLSPSSASGAGWLLFPLAVLVKGLPLLLLVVLTVRLAHRRERRWLDAALSSEVGGEAVSGEELAILRSPRRRRGAVADMRKRAGRRAADLLARLQREQVNLGMIASRVQDPDDPALVVQRDYCRSLRAALSAMPGAARAGSETPTG
ncbi:MAG: PrsW family intramembrane metalloprotease [Actinomycetota bacterium]